MSPLLALALLFAELSLLAIGGVASTLPEMARQAVDVYHWVDRAEFAGLFGLAQAAPGPNMLIATLLGWHVAGLSGALVASTAMVLPSSTLTVFAAGAWERFRTARWRRVLQAAITPITAGLLLAAATLLVRNADRDWPAILITAGVAAITLRGRLHPLWLLAAGALIGVVGAT